MLLANSYQMRRPPNQSKENEKRSEEEEKKNALTTKCIDNRMKNTLAKSRQIEMRIRDNVNKNSISKSGFNEFFE